MSLPVHFSLLTYNIHKGFNITNRRFVLHNIREILQETGADIAFLQEIQGEHIGRGASIENWPEVSQYEFLADQVWPHYAYGKNAIYNAGHHGNAILSKFPFTEWENVNVSWLKRASRSLLHGIVSIPILDRQIHVICVHMDQLKFIRNQQLKRLAHRIEEKIPAEAPLIVAGDFNDWGDHASNFLFTGPGLKEVHHAQYGHHAMTYPAAWPMFALDRIYYRNIDLVTCKPLNEKPWHALSDHSPLYAEFRLKDESDK
jgi:endonuclease/exonuclease/phosphatase family metal-dependent hydrolase